MLEKQIELLIKSIEETEKVIKDYESNDFLESIQDSLKATQTVLKSLVDAVVSIDEKVNTSAAPEALMKSLNGEVSEVFGSIEKALTTIADRVDALEKSPEQRRSTLMKSEAMERFSKLLDNRFAGQTTTTENLTKSASKQKIAGILMKGIEAGQMKMSAVTRFEMGGVQSLMKSEIDYVESALKA